MKRKKQLQIGSIYALLILLSFIWLFPIIWVILTSFRGEGTAYVPYIIPKTWTLDNYIKLFTNSSFPFGRWFFKYLNRFNSHLCSVNFYHSGNGLFA